VTRLLIVAAVALAATPSAVAASACSPATLESQVMCPTCAGQTLDQSQAPAAQRVKAFIRVRSREGDSCEEIKAALVDDFGERILAAPPREGFNLLAWLLPLAGLLAGAVGVTIVALRWSRRRDAEPAEAGAAVSGNGRLPVDAELERRLDEELARFE
jgi:cytochrome c-type biogenesis protein CcmH